MPEPTPVTRSRLPFIAIGVWAAILALIVAVGLVFGGRAASDTTTAPLGAGGPGAAALNLNAPLAADPSASANPSAGASAAPGTKDNKTPKGPRGFAFGRGGFGPSGPGGPGPGGPGRGPISIAAISGSSLSLKTDDGWTRTIDATGATITELGGATLTVGDLKVGDHIAFRQTRNADGTYTVTTIVRIPAQAAGTVKTVTGTSATLEQPDGSTKTIGLTGTTTYTLNGAAATAADLKVGARAHATGTEDGSGNFTATKVEIAPAQVAGTVTAKTADTITILTRAGTSVTIHVNASTKYQIRGNNAATIADVAVGNVAQAEGTQNADGSLDATVVRAASAKAGGFGRPDGHGKGKGPGNPNASPAPSTSGG